MWKTVISQRETETSTGQVCGPQCFPLQYLLLVSNIKTYSTHYQVAWCQINKGKNAVKGCRLLTPISRQLIYCVRWWEQWMVKNLDRSSFFLSIREIPVVGPAGAHGDSSTGTRGWKEARPGICFDALFN